MYSCPHGYGVCCFYLAQLVSKEGHVNGGLWGLSSRSGKSWVEVFGACESGLVPVDFVASAFSASSLGIFCSENGQ